MALIEVDIEDYLDEVSDNYLIDELKRRGYIISRKNLKIKNEQHEFKTDNDLLNYLKDLMGLRRYHDNERLIYEIRLKF